MSDSGLKSCPFCGGEPYMFRDVAHNVDDGLSADGTRLWFICCDVCPAVIGGNDKGQVIAAWNRRV